MKPLGLTAQKLLYQAWPQDEKLVPQWEEDTYPEIKRGAKKAAAPIYLVDEWGIGSDDHTGQTWASRGREASDHRNRKLLRRKYDLCRQCPGTTRFHVEPEDSYSRHLQGISETVDDRMSLQLRSKLF
jgi:hypothetical protein